MNMPRPHLRIPSLLLFALPALALSEVQPGAKPPREVAERTRPALEDGRRALAAKDAAAVHAAVSRAIETLGPWAGNPETATRYFPPVDRAPFDAAQAREWWVKEIARGQRGLPWLKNPAGDPRRMPAGLREAAWPIGSLARTALALPEQREELTKIVRAGADWLIARQRANGGFPFPVGPGLNPREKVGYIVQGLIKEHPEIVVDGWISNDFGDGGLQFDNGLCGGALVSVWELTHDDRYLAAAKRVGDWASAQPLVSNWNYNAFSAGLLARLARATGETDYLTAAVEKAEVGVLPGQMPSGRWFDHHNACAVYHNIILRELLDLYAALPSDHNFREPLRDALVRGLDQASGETLARGYTGTWTDNFARALVVLGENGQWRAALNVNLNAAGKNGAPTPGFAIVTVLELIAAQPPR
jgi:hypothetical protein